MYIYVCTYIHIYLFLNLYYFLHSTTIIDYYALIYMLIRCFIVACAMYLFISGSCNCMRNAHRAKPCLLCKFCLLYK